MSSATPISVIMVTRNAPAVAKLCLQSLLVCADALASRGGEVEFILADDCSIDGRDPLALFKEFRSAARFPVKLMRFVVRQHYAGAVAHTMSIARGDVLFVSHDMIITPACVQELFEVAESRQEFGVFRPRSGHMDWTTQMELPAPRTNCTIAELNAFATEIRQQFRGQVTGWPVLIGDAMFIRREVIERIGVFDTRFFGYWSDLDFGVRVQRAGWRHGIAAGAWLHHFGKGAGMEPASTGGQAVAQTPELTASESDAGFEVFRRKWSTQLPERQQEMTAQHYRDLRRVTSPDGGEVQPALPITPDVAEML